jgi:excisionase family DNA binding protein
MEQLRTQQSKAEQRGEDGMQTKLYTVPEAAALLSLSPKTIWKMCYAREISCVRPRPRSVRIPASAIEEIIEANTTPAKVA